ncbi:MAG: hypothetical protein CV087_16320 [Candidatus Brocadia sp. WS118]|nr:MAG: hypothetical protein CV087_16320 [Candidatus Brocadia sp. WS118]
MKILIRHSVVYWLLFFIWINASASAGIVFEGSSHKYHEEYNVADLLNLPNPNYHIRIPLPVLPRDLGLRNYYITSTQIIIKLYATWPSASPPRSITHDFEMALNFNLYKTSLNNSFTGRDIQLRINPDQPLSAFVDNFDDRILNRTTLEDQFFYLKIEDLSDNYYQGTPAWNDILSTLKISVEYTIEYGIDVFSEGFGPTVNKAIVGPGKVVNFSWDNLGRNFPSYHFQLLKLYNYSGTTSDENQQITATIDWSKALNIYTESNATSLALSITEGTGFYLWRVRPVGTYYKGKEAHALNYGHWNEKYYPIINGNQITLTRVQAQSEDLPFKPVFFFQDPDEDINYIHSRTFTEKNRTSEKITYANSLLQPKQVQSSIRSQNTTLVTQTVPDLNGRPVLSTLPVPIPNENADGLGSFTYKSKFMKKPSGNVEGELFTAWDYDTDDKVYNPEKVDDGNRSAFSYYSDNNPDINIPGAEGYPYSRTIYYNDGTGRVKEQSGVGKTHMVAEQQSNHGGRTVRTMYATPAETELVRVFGDEAPAPESVLKTITIDQNNTAQIVYTNRAGQTIATAVSFHENGLPSSLSLPANAFNTFPVEDKTIFNMKTDQGFISTKRLALLKETVVNIDYKVKCTVLEGLCVDTIVDCGYQLELYLHNLTDGSSELLVRQPISSNCDENGEIGLTSPITKTLPSGNYIIEKKLIPKKDPEAQIAVAVDRVNEQIEPLTNLIYGWYEALETIDDIIDFKTKLDQLQQDVHDLPSEDLKNKYGLPATFEKTEEHSVTPVYTIISAPASDGTPIEFQSPTIVEVTSACCRISIPVGFMPDIIKPPNDDYTPTNGEASKPNPYYFIQPEKTEFPLDLEGYSLSFLRFAGCEHPEYVLYGFPVAVIPEPIRESFAHRISKDRLTQELELSLMEGWESGDLNWMVYHMLMDEYSVDGSKVSTPEIKRQYTFEEIVDCWTSVLIMLRDLACNGRNYGEPPFNISDNVDNENYKANNNPGDSRPNSEIHDDHVDDEFGELSWGMRFLLGISGAHGKVRDAQKNKIDGSGPPAALYYPHHLIKQFLDCTSYKFAKILTPDEPCPLPQDAEPDRMYQVGVDVDSVAVVCVTSPGNLMKYNPDPNFSPRNIDKEFFPGVRDPHFAFKYFTYGYEQVEQFINGHHQIGIDLKFPDLELLTCFNDPNICEDAVGISVPCCPDEPDALCNFCGIGTIVCEQTHKNWSAGQRYSFFETIRNYVEQEINPSSDWENVDCESFKTDEYPADDANGMNWIKYGLHKLKTSCESSCDERRPFFKDDLLDALERNCYVIGGCRTDDPSQNYIISLEDVEAMVDSLVEQCKSQCDIKTYRCVDKKKCRPINKGKREYAAVATSDHPSDFITYRELEFGVGDPTDFTKDNCVEDPPGSGIWRCDPITEPPSYTEAILRQQAMHWLPEISVPPMCDVNPNCDKICPDGFTPNNTITDIDEDDKQRLRAKGGTLYDPTGITRTEPIKSDAVQITTSINVNN